MRIRVVVFDLGGVLNEFAGIEELSRLTGATTAEVLSRWLTSPWVRTFECGDCTADAFARGFVAEWRLTLSPEKFLAAFASWARPYDGTEALLQAVADRARVSCLSNTNEIHFRQAASWPFMRLFDPAFLSFELGLVKPDRAIFDHVRDHLGVDPGDVLYLDDAEQNVTAARSTGFHARHVRGLTETRAALAKFGVLQPADFAKSEEPGSPPAHSGSR